MELLPVAWDDWCPKGGYEVRVYAADDVVYDKKFSFESRIDGHLHVYALADAFRCGPQLIGETIYLEWPGAAVDAAPAPYRLGEQDISLQIGPWWLSAVLCGLQPPRGEAVLVCDFLLALEEEYGHGLEKNLVFRLAATPHDAWAFGVQLFAECEAAEATRASR